MPVLLLFVIFFKWISYCWVFFFNSFIVRLHGRQFCQRLCWHCSACSSSKRLPKKSSESKRGLLTSTDLLSDDNFLSVMVLGVPSKGLCVFLNKIWNHWICQLRVNLAAWTLNYQHLGTHFQQLSCQQQWTWNTAWGETFDLINACDGQLKWWVDSGWMGGTHQSCSITRLLS